MDIGLEKLEESLGENVNKIGDVTIVKKRCSNPKKILDDGSYMRSVQIYKSGSGHVAVPKELLRKLNLVKGSRLRISLTSTDGGEGLLMVHVPGGVE